MKVAIIGATGSIGSTMYRHVLLRDDINDILVVTRRPMPSGKPSDSRVRNILIPDFGALDAVSDAVWSSIEDADTIIWAIGTYDLNKDVNYTYPMEFQKTIIQRLVNSRAGGRKRAKLRFILLGGAFTETDQSRWLFFLPEQRRMKGLLQAETIASAEKHSDLIVAHVIKPGGILLGWDESMNWIVESVFGPKLAVRGEELGAFTADLAVHGSEKALIENWEIVQTGRRLTPRT